MLTERRRESATTIHKSPEESLASAVAWTAHCFCLRVVHCSSFARRRSRLLTRQAGRQEGIAILYSLPLLVGSMLVRSALWRATLRRPSATPLATVAAVVVRPTVRLASTTRSRSVLLRPSRTSLWQSPLRSLIDRKSVVYEHYAR